MPRFKVSFWLDISKDDERELLESVHELKRVRAFSRTVRDGIRLIISLREGKTDVLSQLFPNILENYLKENTTQIHVLSGANSNLSEPLTATPRKEISKPEQTDLNFTITQSKPKENQNPSYNILLSMARLNDNWADLPTEVLEYGIKNKKIPASVQKIIDQRSQKKQVSAALTEPKSMGGPKQLAGGAIKFEAPPDDIELDFGL